MASVTFQVLEGIDKGRTFRELPTPVTIGREEGNVLRLNDERVSRFHAKVQADSGEIILTDLESTNGTRVNGNVIQIRRLRAGDCVGVGRSLLLFGTETEIAARHAALQSVGRSTQGLLGPDNLPATVHGKTMGTSFGSEDDFDLSPTDKITFANGTLFANARPLPPLPMKMTPSQAARLAELLEFLHQRLIAATENIQANEEGSQIVLTFADWQRVMAVQMVLARYARAVAEPDALEE